MSETQPAIVLEHVSKWFNKRAAHSFKDTFVNWIKRRPVRTQQFQALNDVSFVINEGECVAVMGMNGSGKSTTLKMVSGVMSPDEGKVRTRGRVAGLIEVGAGFHPDLTGRENVFLNAAILGMTEAETKARFDEIVEFSEIGDFIDQEVKHYSSGMFMRLAFSVAIHVELDVLLVDEVLAVGDAPFREKCNTKLKEMATQGVTMMIVSHSKGQVKELCSRGIVIRKGEVIFDGAITPALQVLDGKDPAQKRKKAPGAKKPIVAKPPQNAEDGEAAKTTVSSELAKKAAARRAAAEAAAEAEQARQEVLARDQRARTQRDGDDVAVADNSSQSALTRRELREREATQPHQTQR